MSNVVYVYGILRPNEGETTLIEGTMYDLGWFPGVKLEGPLSENVFVAERIVVSDERLEQFDQIEGYREGDPDSLYIRQPFRDGWIYEYNHSIEGRERVESGDWSKHKQVEALCS